MSKGTLIVAASLISCSTLAAKDARTYYTDARIAAGRQNAAKYEWGRALKRRILETGDTIKYYIGPTYTAANRFAAQSDEFMWLLQPPTKIPRCYDVKFRTICPKCGSKVKKISVWNAWRIEPIGHPYQVQCPMCSAWYPSNKIHEGDATSGDYPDDGSGWPHEGKRYYFLREYAHMCYGSVVVPTLQSLSQAYLLTGEAKYAHKGCILLARLATEYPNYGWKRVKLVDQDAAKLENRFERTFVGWCGGTHPHYKWKKGGMITDLIWETFCLEATAYAYDAFYDHMASDAELIAFVKAKGMPVENAADLRRYIETYVFRAAMDGLLKGMIRGNEGFHQAAALAVALVMDDYSDNVPNSKTMVDYAFHGSGRAAYMMINGLDRDGGGHESPNYNRIKCDFIRVAELMNEIRRRHADQFPLDKYPDIFAHPKARGLFDYYIDVLILDTQLPSIGDCGGIGPPDRYTAKHRRWSSLKQENLYAFRRYGDPRYARASTALDGKPYGGELWEPYPADAIADALKHPASNIVRTTRLLDGYGVAILESGQWPKSRAVMLNYASTVGHRQRDPLTIQVYARGLSLLPDLGYPRTWDHRWQWDSNSLAHNTVTVNELQPASRSFRNAARLFATADGVHVVTAQHNPYPEKMGLGRKGARTVDLYERTAVLVDVDDDRFYVVDVFAVNGGEQHDQSWHAMLVKSTPPPLDWRSQGTGTLAGPNIAQFAAYTDRWGRKHEKGDFACYLTDVRRAALNRPACWTWPSGLPEGDALRLHVLPVGGAAEVIMGKGRSPVWPAAETLDYLLVRRRVEGGAASHFVSVLDAYDTAPVVTSVRLVSENPIVIEVARADGVDEVTIHLPPGPSRTTAHRPVGVRVRSTKGDRRRDVRIGQLPDDAGPGYATGTIVGVDYEANTILVTAGSATADDLAPGRAVRVHNGMRSAMFEIIESKREDGCVRVTLDKTALVAQFPITAVDKGRLQLGVKAPFVTGHVDEKTGALTDGPNDYYYGCRFGEGKGARLVAGISNTNPPCLYVVGPSEGAESLKGCVGKVMSVWLYGVGDTVEVARIRQ